MKKLYNQVTRSEWHESKYAMPVIARYGTGGGNVPIIVMTAYGFDSYNQVIEKEIAQPLRSHDGGDTTPKVIADTMRGSNQGYNIFCGGQRMPDKENFNCVMKSYVRRLTPLECERLQGFPDGWTDIGEWVDTKGKKHQTADSARYKALGNSIALPFWKVLARRISAQYDRDITMGSLFDGIGGFPLAFEHCGGKAVWASEIEEFPIAVTKVRFKE